ncbi:MAG TPA: phosphoribosylformylglycinamidine cyclo-ligase, partial [Bdellovibrionota bacterium]|nr:phosphoribosylformylglycinamidine cyclo-ligase [Bdellovibrionota bacterium]
MAKLTYAKSGVNRAGADKLVERIGGLVKGTLNSKVVGGVGGYASLYDIGGGKCVAASTDGVGTKLKLAFELGIHDTVGIDLVAMSVNDLLCTGADPLFFLDYFATGKLQNRIAEQVIAGVAEGCRQAQCALVGGETAEMPDIYSPGEYDLAGFAVGLLERRRMLPSPKLKAGHVLIGVGSSGFHSNGFSLLRRLLPASGAERKRWAKKLLEPTKIYVQTALPQVRKGNLLAMAHVTGSGVLNIPRMGDHVSYRLTYPKAADLPEVFDWIRAGGRVDVKELYQTFNMGLGLIVAVEPSKAETVLRALRGPGEPAWIVGEVVKRRTGKPSEVFLTDRAGRKPV